MNKSIDVTDKVSFGEVDAEFLPLTKCVCNKEFQLWDLVLSIYNDDLSKCSSCGRKFYFTNKVTVYEVVDEQ